MHHECKLCGSCCSPGWFPGASYAAAIMRPEEMDRIASHLGLTVDEMCEVYGINQSDGHMRTDKEPCRFLTMDQRCSIHSVKPVLCVGYPWGNVRENPVTLLENASKCLGLTLDREDHKKIQKGLVDVCDGIKDEEVWERFDEKRPDELFRDLAANGKTSRSDYKKVIAVLNKLQSLARAIFFRNHVPQ